MISKQTKWELERIAAREAEWEKKQDAKPEMGVWLVVFALIGVFFLAHCTTL